MIRDYVFRVHGDCVRAGYAYPLLAALKMHVLHMAERQDVYFGPLTGVLSLGRGCLGVRKGTEWRCRAPSELQPGIEALCGRKLLLVNHVIQLGWMHTEDLVSHPTLHAEMVCLKSQHCEVGERHPLRGEFIGWVADKLRRQYGLADGRHTFEVGRRRVIRIGKHPASVGYALSIYGLSPSESIAIQQSGLGGRRHMGASLFVPGPMAEFLRSDRSMLDVSPRDWRRRGAAPQVDARYSLAAALFMTAVTKGRRPCHRWLAAEVGLSMTAAHNMIRSFRRDLQLPFEYDRDAKGYRPCEAT